MPKGLLPSQRSLLALDGWASRVKDHKLITVYTTIFFFIFHLLMDTACINLTLVVYWLHSLLVKQHGNLLLNG